MIHFENEYLKVSIIPKGATLYSIQAMIDGAWKEVLLQYEDINQYEDNPKYLNCICGYHAGRVKSAQFQLDGNTILLDVNSGLNHLHGGRKGLHTFDFEAEPIDQGVRLTYDHTLSFIELIYKLDQDQLKINYIIKPKKDLLVNPTQHFYFKLDGQSTIENNQLQIPAERVMLVDDEGVPTGEWYNVAESAFDFRESTSIKTRMNQDHPQFKVTGFIDHGFETLKRPVLLVSEEENIRLSLWSDASMHVVYTCNKFDPNYRFVKYGEDHDKIAIAIEPQECPNGVNLQTNPSQIYRNGEVFTREMILKINPYHTVS